MGKRDESVSYTHLRIVRIAEGNARIAILAGKVAFNSNRLDSINDVSQLYEDYYGSSLEDNQMLANNNVCITAGIVAFLEAIHLDHIDPFLPILQEKGLNRDAFIENIYIDVYKRQELPLHPEYTECGQWCYPP